MEVRQHRVEGGIIGVDRVVLVGVHPPDRELHLVAELGAELQRATVGEGLGVRRAQGREPLQHVPVRSHGGDHQGPEVIALAGLIAPRHRGVEVQGGILSRGLSGLWRRRRPGVEVGPAGHEGRRIPALNHELARGIQGGHDALPLRAELRVGHRPVLEAAGGEPRPESGELAPGDLGHERVLGHRSKDHTLAT